MPMIALAQNTNTRPWSRDLEATFLVQVPVHHDVVQATVTSNEGNSAGRVKELEEDTTELQLTVASPRIRFGIVWGIAMLVLWSWVAVEVTGDEDESSCISQSQRIPIIGARTEKHQKSSMISISNAHTRTSSG